MPKVIISHILYTGLILAIVESIQDQISFGVESFSTKIIPSTPSSFRPFAQTFFFNNIPHDHPNFSQRLSIFCDLSDTNNAIFRKRIKRRGFPLLSTSKSMDDQNNKSASSSPTSSIPTSITSSYSTNTVPSMNQMSLSPKDSPQIKLSKGENYSNNRQQTSYGGHKNYRNQRNRNHHQMDDREKIKSMFKTAKNMERIGRWRKASQILRDILEIDPKDSYSHLALARLESRREQSGRIKKTDSSLSSNQKNSQTNNDDAMKDSSFKDSAARNAFRHGTQMCPKSIHLWQAWAVYEQELGNNEKASELFRKALELDDCNPYVCHAFGLMEKRGGNVQHARELWEKSLTKHSTAALVCSLGQLYASSGEPEKARDLYASNINRFLSERERVEIYLAAAWLEERHFSNIDEALNLLKRALELSPSNGRAHVALLRLEGRKDQIRSKKGEKSEKSNDHHNNSMRKRLADVCTNSVVEDGRLFNAWARLEVKDGRLEKARNILRQAMIQFPKDQSLFQAAGKVEERCGNYAAARDLYSKSLLIEPSAPTLVAFALLELRHPENNFRNITKVRRLFDEALLIEPRHGPAYNAYGNMELRMGNRNHARQIFERGVEKNCTDAASVYHGYAKLELSLGNVDEARNIMMRGLQQVESQEGNMLENPQHKRSIFLTHTLGMLELNSHRVAKAKSIFAHGIEIHGDSSQLLLGAALCEVRSGNEDGARQLFEKAVNADKRHAHAWQSWGVMEMRAGNLVVAKTLFECGIKSDPRHGALWQAYATMESRMGNIETARALFAAGIAKCPKHVPLYEAWACLELRGGNLDQARRLISEALTRNKRGGSGWLVAAKIEEKGGNDGLAMLLLRRGLENAPNNPEMYCALANQEVKRGRINEARALLEKGLEVDPLHAPLYHTLAEVEARVFNLEGLAILNKRAAEVFNNNALVPPPAYSQAWGKKIRMGRSKKLPEAVTSLMEKVGFDDVQSITDVDPTSVLDNMILFEEGIIGEMLSSNVENDKK